MNVPIQYLLKLARRNLQAYIAIPKATFVTSSVAEELCDEYSDCDISI
ncbi:hypothetical protein [Gloeothece citriformis]|nr:hypothetical protein [Gloeothece citriformis]